MAKTKSRRSASGGGRKAARATGRRKTARKAAAGRKKTAARKVRKTQARKAAPRRQAKATPKRKAAARKATGRKGSDRKPAGRNSVVRKTAAPSARPAATQKARSVGARKTPALNRERRVVREDDIVPTPPSSLDMDRSASAARTGRRELHDRYVEHTETSPAITGGDVDADWESAYTVGDEAPGGDNPTPDQDVVDEIGAALGVQYADNEELKGEKKISDRDRKRWELDPASSEDYSEHDKD